MLALVLARGGSKRLPRKNIRLLGGKPLIAWSIECARALPGVDEVLVSTDDAEIADVARSCGAVVPWLRPADLASDTASSADAIAHAIERCREDGRTFDILLLLPPTSPFRDLQVLTYALALCIEADGAPVVGFAKASSHPGWCFTLDDLGYPIPVMDAKGVTQRSQDLPAVYEVSGNFYVIGTAEFARDPSFFTPSTRAVVTEDRRLNVDIDDAFDWLVAQAVATEIQGAV